MIPMTDGNSEDPAGQHPPGGGAYGQQPGQGAVPPGEPQNPSGPPPTQPYSQPYGQGTPPAPYGQPAGPPYGQQPGYPGYYPAYGPPQDGGAQAALIVGLVALGLGLIGCGIGFLGSPVAWYLGLQSKRRIDASNGQLSGRGNAQAGFVLGIVGTALLAFLLLIVLAFVVIIGLSVDWHSAETTPGTPA